MDLLQSVINAYWSQARYFAYGHIAVVIFVTWSLFSFARWKFDDEPTPTIWQQFEIRANFIHGLIGLFLIIGIAGTFLGLWEVASSLDRSDVLVPSAATPAAASSPVAGAANPDVGAAAQSDRTIRLLFSGIAKAFPVGFVGLLLTLAANFAASLIERSKRRKIEAFMDEVKDPMEVLATLLSPLASLGTILGNSLQPVINKLAMALEPIPLMMSEQRHELSSAKDALIVAAEALKTSGSEISSSVEGLQSMAATSRQALDSATKLSKRIDSYFDEISVKLDTATTTATKSFQTYDASLTAMRESVVEAAQEMRNLPTTLRADLTKSLTESFNESSQTREGALNDLYNEARQSFRENMTNAMSDVTLDLKRIRSDFEDVAKKVDVSVANANNAYDRYERSWNEQAAKLREQIIGQIDPGLKPQIENAAADSQQALEAATKAAEDLTASTKVATEKIDRTYRESAKLLTTASETLAQRLGAITRSIETAAARLEPSPSVLPPKPQSRPFAKKISDFLFHPLTFRSRNKPKK